MPPGRYRSDRSLEPVQGRARLTREALAHLRGGITMEPRFEERDAFRLVGMASWFESEPHRHIPALWGRFAPRIAAVPGRVDERCYGLCHGTGSGLFYLAGVEVASFDDVPVDMVAKPVAAQRYAVFTHAGHVSEFHRTVDHVWGTWLPRSDHEPVPDAVDFELYDERFDGATGRGEIEYWVPVRGSGPPRPA